RAEPALHDDAGGHVQPAVADCVPARRTDARHRESRGALARDAAGREHRRGQRAGGPPSGPGRHARRVSVAALRDGPRGVSHVLGAGERRIQPGARPRASLDRRRDREPRRAAGALAADAEGTRRPVRRANRLLARRQVPVPDGRRPAADDARAGPESGARKNPAADARWQAGARQPDGRQDRRQERPADRSAARHRGGEDGAGRRHVHLPGTEPRAGRDELNLIEPGKNYGWPLVSYATNYDGVAIPSPTTRPDLAQPVIYWTPIIAPGNLTFYNG